MENSDFDKIFAQRFKQLPGEPYREAGWTEMSGRLKHHERRRRRWLIPVILPLFGLLAGGNVFWWLQWRQLASQWKHTGQSERRTTQFDTLVHTTVIYRYDTVYQKTTLIGQRPTEIRVTSGIQLQAHATRTGFQNDGSGEQGSARPEIKDPVTLREGLSGELVENEQVVRSESATDIPAAGRIFSVSQDTVQEHLPVPARPVTTDTATWQPPVTYLPVIKTRRPILTLARPRLAFSAGWANPMLDHKRSGALWGAGLGADVQIARNLRLGADFHYWQGKLKADETGELTGIDIPDPGNDYLLRYWETYKLPVFTYAAQLKYYLSVKKNWTPWMGIGTQFATLMPFEIEFDFENQSNHLELFVPGQTGAVTHWQGLTVAMGLEGKIGQRLGLGADAFLLQHPGKNRGIIGRQVGLQTRLFYHF